MNYAEMKAVGIFDYDDEDDDEEQDDDENGVQAKHNEKYNNSRDGNVVTFLIFILSACAFVLTTVILIIGVT